MHSSAMRLGSIEFINSLPVDLGLLSGAVKIDAQIVPGTPAELNDRMILKELEVSPVSAFWYAMHADEFLLLPELSISSESGVESVLLFSRSPIADLAGKTIGLTGKGRTTPALLEILCRSKYGFKPQFAACPWDAQGLATGLDAMLLIGDEALLARENLGGEVRHVTDLAEEWRGWTGLPVVFAVWAVQRDVFMFWPDKVAEIHKALLRSKAWGHAHPEDVVRRAHEKTRLSREALTAYFSKLSFSFDGRLRTGLGRFFSEAAKCGLLRPGVEIEEIKEIALTS